MYTWKSEKKILYLPSNYSHQHLVYSDEDENSTHIFIEKYSHQI